MFAWHSFWVNLVYLIILFTVILSHTLNLSFSLDKNNNNAKYSVNIECFCIKKRLFLPLPLLLLHDSTYSSQRTSITPCYHFRETMGHYVLIAEKDRRKRSIRDAFWFYWEKESLHDKKEKKRTYRFSSIRMNVFGKHFGFFRVIIICLYIHNKTISILNLHS